MPKKKGGKKGAKIIDGVATNEMTREQLMGHMKRMQMELDREREERNFFMLEREKLYALWNITLEQLAGAKTHARLSDVRMDENEREREYEMHVYKQRIRHLMTEQGRKVSEVRLHNLQRMKNMQQDMNKVESSMRDTIESKNGQIFKCQTSLHEIMKQMQLDNSQNAVKLRQDFCQEIRRMESTYERLMFEKEQAQQLEERAELQRTAEEKSELVQQLIDLHAKQIAEMKEYFNEITVNNFAVISAMQQDLRLMRQREETFRVELEKTREANKELQKKMEEGKHEYDTKISKDLTKVAEMKRQILRGDRRIKEMSEWIKTLELSQEALVQKSALQKKEGDALKAAFTHAILDVQKRTQYKTLVLQMKLNAISTNNMGRRNDEGSGGKESGSSSASSDGGRHSNQYAYGGVSSPSDVGDEVDNNFGAEEVVAK